MGIYTTLYKSIKSIDSKYHTFWRKKSWIDEGCLSISWDIYINPPEIHTNPNILLFSLQVEIVRFVYISVKNLWRYVPLRMKMYIDIYPLGYPCPNIGYPCPKYGYPCPNTRISMSEYGLGTEALPLHRHSSIWPRPLDRAIGPYAIRSLNKRTRRAIKL